MPVTPKSTRTQRPSAPSRREGPRAPGRRPAAPAPLKVFCKSLGCPKTRVDTEHLLGSLSQAWAHRGGILAVDRPQAAELIVINTCGFIQPAVEESLGEILAAAKAKVRGSRSVRPLLAVAGCLVSRYPHELAPDLPEVDLWLPLESMDSWPERIAQALRLVAPAVEAPTHGAGPARLRSTPPSYAYLKVSEGCNHACSFCAIPAIRGPLRSQPLPLLVQEARQLLDEGVKELVLVAQDLTAYGRESAGGPGVRELIEALAALPGLVRLRPMYLYPAGLTDELLSFLATAGPPLVPYFDVPLQHAHPDILRRMGRPFASDPRRVVERIRRHIPHATLRTSVIVGFPGEQETHLEALLDFVREVRFQHLGAFPYWAEDGTPAALLDGQLPQQVKDGRVRQVMSVQEEVSTQELAALVGQTLEVLVDEPSPEWPGLHIGRAWFQAPEVDGVTYVSGEGVEPGALVTAQVEQSTAHDLSALA